jgi:N-acetylneuraminic acid mutarotase
VQAILILFRSLQNITQHYLLSTHMKATLFIVSYFVLGFSDVFAQQWTSISSFPGTQRDDGVSFVINDDAYCGTGLEVGWTPTRNFYQLNMNTDTWSQVSAMPIGNERQYACGFSYQGYGYVFGGINNNVLNDLWRYDANANTWTQLSAKPGEGLAGSACFTLPDTAIIIGGNNSSTSASKQVWAYIISSDQWVRLSDLPNKGLWRASACNVNGIGYLLGGKDSLGLLNPNVYQYHSSQDNWSVIHSSHVSARIYASCVSTQSQLVLLAGIDSSGIYHDEMQQFDFSNQAWIELLPKMPSARKGGMCFTNYFKVYYTTGIDSSNTRLNATIKIDYPTQINESADSGSLITYPQPATEKVFFNSRSCDEIVLFTMHGEILAQSFFTNELDISQYQKGNYMVRVKLNGSYFLRPIIKL